MSLIVRKGFLDTSSLLLQTKRFRGKLNVRKGRLPHPVKLQFQVLTKPIFVSQYKDKPLIELCRKSQDKVKEEEDNPLQRIIAGELLELFKSSRLIGFYHKNAMTGDDKFAAYAQFKKRNMCMKNFGKKTMEWAIKGTPYETCLEFYCSHNMTVFSPEPNIKDLLRVSKKFPQLILLAAVFEGKLISRDKLLEYSLIPDLATAQAGLVQLLNGIGGQLVCNLTTHQNTLVSHLEERAKQLQEEQS